jgi:hypothetical protein
MADTVALVFIAFVVIGTLAGGLVGVVQYKDTAVEHTLIVTGPEGVSPVTSATAVVEYSELHADAQRRFQYAIDDSYSWGASADTTVAFESVSHVRHDGAYYNVLHSERPYPQFQSVFASTFAGMMLGVVGGVVLIILHPASQKET